MNNVVLTGRLGKDVELKHTSSGKTVANFSLAVNDGYGDKQKTYWVDVITWEKTAELAAKYLQKGSLVGIQGKLQTRQFEDKSGNNRKVTEIVALNLEFLDKTSENPMEKSKLKKEEVTDEEFVF